MDFISLAKARYSARGFSEKKVEDEKLNKIIEAARIAPSARNSQPWKILLVKSDKGLEKIRKIHHGFGSSSVFVVCADTERQIKRGSTDGTYNEVDTSIAITQMALCATSLGLGTTIVGAFDPKQLSEEFDLPKNIKPMLLLPCGYPNENGGVSQRHADRLSIEEMSEIL